MKRTLLSILFLLVFITVLSGCMAFRGEDFKDFSQIYPERTSQIQKNDFRIQYIMNAAQYTNGTLMSSSQKTKIRYSRVLEKVLAVKQIFGEFGSAVSNPDWSIKIDIREEEHFNEILALLSAFTLCIIPSQTSYDMIATATVFDKDGNQLETLSAKQDVKVLIQILFLLPWRGGLIEQAQENLFKDIILQLEELATQKG